MTYEAMQKLRAMPRNLDKGRWAVAIVGMRGWRRDGVIGDGITAALNALLTRCSSKAEAVRLAQAWNDAQPGVLPGSPDVFVYEARPYRCSDYIGSQELHRHGARECARRIANP